jgi:1,4-dihydroxy-2-naphthoate octaprenyltransferase
MAHTNEEVKAFLQRADVAAIGTTDLGMPRQRMMHFAVGDNFEIYVSSMKGDPKILQWRNVPQTAVLVHTGKDFMEMEECEIIGRAVLIEDEEERKIATEIVAKKSPIVSQFVSMNATDRLDFIKIVPHTVKYRFIPEVLQGQPPTFIEFPENKEQSNKWADVMSRLRVWRTAIRPLSLTAALVPLLLGSVMAFAGGSGFHWGLFTLVLLGGIMIQAGTNLINDWHDADRDATNLTAVRPFTGGSRVIQLGLITRAEVGFVGLFLSLAALAIGISLVFIKGVELLPLIAYGLLAGLFYTSAKGKFSFINLGVGIAEIIIATTYGVFMTMGAYFVQAGHFSIEAFLVSLVVSILVMNVLVINQFQDRESDEKSGKKTLAVRIGKRNTMIFLTVMFSISMLIPAVLLAFELVPTSILFSYLAVPFIFQAARFGFKFYDQDAVDLIPSNANTAISHLLVGLLLSFAYIIELDVLWLSISSFVVIAGFVFWVWAYIERQRKVMTQFKLSFKNK